VRRFWYNWFLRNQAFSGYPFPSPFIPLDRTAARWLWYGNAMFAWWEDPNWQVDDVYWIDQIFWPAPEPTTSRDAIGFNTVYDQFVVVPDFALVYPRERFRVPRYSNTGISLRRRNLA